MIRRLAVIATSVVALGGLSAVPAHATSLTTKTISGTFSEIGPDNFVRLNPTPPNVFVGVDVHPIVFAGSLVGTATSTEHFDSNVVTGNFETHNTEAFDNVTLTADDGTVLGTGSVVFNFNAHGFFTYDSSGNVVNAGMTGVWQVVSASG